MNNHRYDAIVVDCPALVPWSDSVVLQQYLDGFLLVVRARRTPRDAIRRALSHVQPGLVQGVVFNEQNFLHQLRITCRECDKKGGQ